MQSYSQIGQDIFVLKLLGPSGFFLDFGCGDGNSFPCGNNTLLLEQNGWSGLSFDIDQNSINAFDKTRKTKAVCVDLTKNLKSILQENNCPKVIDYFSFDVDEATDAVLDSFPFGEYTFKFISFEHNLYLPQYRGLKERSQEIFFKHGYKLLIDNVCFNGRPVEDWYYKFDEREFLGYNIEGKEAYKLL